MLLQSIPAAQSSDAYIAAVISLMSGAERVIDEMELVRENNGAYSTPPRAVSLEWHHFHFLVFSPV